MKFLVDAHLPRRLARWLEAVGHGAVHTLDLPDGNRTTDTAINAVSLRDGSAVISKDADFINSHLLTGEPRKLLVVSTGNITNAELEGLFAVNLPAIVKAFQEHDYLELTRTTLIVHA